MRDDQAGAATPQSEPQSEHSRRTFLTASATVLASVSLPALLPDLAVAAPAVPVTAGAAATDLALHRPVRASSTAYAPTPARFVTDRLGRAGVTGSGWRAADTDGPQWIAVDLEATCRVTAVVLVFEAIEGDTVFKPSDGINPRTGTTGWEVLSSYAAAFRIEVSPDGKTWKEVYEGSTDQGGTVTVTLAEPVDTRWVRMVGTGLSNDNPLGLNSLQVHGIAPSRRPKATGWTEWTSGARPVPLLKIADDGTVPIESGWNVTLDEFAGTDSGARLSSPGVDTDRWLRARVPGTILASLVAEGHLPDPVKGMDNLQVPEALGKSTWWYRRTFSVPRGLVSRGRDRLWLELDGINHAAEIWLDGTKVGEMSHPTARAALDVTEQLGKGGEHVLAVRIDHMPYPGSPGDRGSNGVSYADAGSDMMMRNGPAYLAVSGWDWMPAVRDRVMGIWNHVRLRATGDVVVGDARVDTVLPDLPDRSRAEVTVTVPVRNAASGARSVTVRALLGGVRVTKDVRIDGGASTEAVFTPEDHPALRLRNPELWWPNGYGEPALHDLRLTASVGRQESDARTIRVGLRQFDYASENPVVFPPGANRYEQTVDIERQHARWVRVLAGRRATGYGASLWRLSVTDTRTPGTDLALHATASASSTDNATNTAAAAVDGDDNTRWSSAYSDDQWIRVDLGAEKDFDRITLLWESAYALTFTVQVSGDGESWTDVTSVDNRPHQLQISVNGVRVFCRGGNWGWDELLRRMGDGRMEAAVEMHRDMNFTMIRNWLGSSNREEFYARCDENGLLVWNDFWNAWFLDPPNHSLYLDHVRDTVRRYRSHPCIVVWCGSNEGTPSGEIDEGTRKAVAEEHPGVEYISNSASGVVSGSGPYAWVDPKRYYSPDLYAHGTFGFHTEIGIPTVSVAESMRNLVGDETEWPIGLVWNHHDWLERGGQNPQSYRAAVDERLGGSSSLDEFSAKAQFVNFESMRAIFEAWNANLWNDAGGLLLWMSNPAWHSTVWQTYDYDLDVNGAYYGARTGCEAHHVQADLEDWKVLAVNHTGEMLHGAEIRAEVLDLLGRRLTDPQRQKVDITASATTQAFTVPRPDGDHPLHLVRLRLTHADGRTLSQNTYWRYDRPEDMRALNGLTGARLEISEGRTVRRDGRLRLSVTVRNRGRAVAPMVRLALRDHRSGNRVLPARYSDNYLWLLPGEERDITVSCPVGGHSPGDLEVTAQGYRTSLVSTHGRR
ncbi:discoidin domain-containing protein [Streptomyces sp. NPDC088747]|uniref:discoidin domain-containing protein n=1 Tax=Streptomyces sp. NPDC088747 TaxID=3365886 RepID=UPI0037F2F3F7